MGQRDVIGIEPGDVAAAGVFQCTVERGGQPSLLRIREHREARVVDACENGACSVRGSIIHDDQFEVADRLPQNALDGGADVTGVIVDGQENRDERHRR